MKQKKNEEQLVVFGSEHWMNYNRILYEVISTTVLKSIVPFSMLTPFSVVPSPSTIEFSICNFLTRVSGDKTHISIEASAIVRTVKLSIKENCVAG